MAEVFHLSLLGFFAMVSLMAILWAIHLKIRNAGIVDAGWAYGLGLLAVMYAVLGDGHPPRRLLIGGMVGAWSLRLGTYILLDRVLGRPEDARYQTLRSEWKTDLPLKFFLFFQLQAILDVALAVPFALIAVNPDTTVSAFEVAGAFLWLIGLTGESIADAQLKRFKSDPANKGKLCQVGLWNYSRHPNYFFEWLIWVAYFLTALGSPGGLLTVYCPALMLYFLFKVTGIPATEAQTLKSKGDAYRRYQQTTSVFVPWFKRKAL